MREECDKCLSLIQNGKCSCGVWYEREQIPPFSKCLEKSILAFNFLNDQKKIGDIFTGDHHSGTCIAIFKGSYENSQMVKKFIEENIL